MGLRGPLPQPTAILRLTRSVHAARRIGEPQPELGEPKKPGWIRGRAAKEWRKVVPELVRLGVLALIDAEALAVYCQAVADVVQLRAILQKEGWTTMTAHGGTIKHPAASAYNEAAARVKAFGAEFGLTPAARVRLRAAGKEAPADPLGEFASEKESDRPLAGETSIA